MRCSLFRTICTAGAVLASLIAATSAQEKLDRTVLPIQAINWVKAQQSMTPDKPFFAYYATGAVHAPHHVPRAWADKYKGHFDKGWEQIRQETLTRQKQMGIIPESTQLAEKPEDLKDWEVLPADHRRLFARQAEVFAGFLEQTDHEIGRFVQALEDIGEMDNTLFIYIAGDNGTSAEGGFVGMYNEMTYFNQVAEKVEDLLPLIDQWGDPQTFPHMAAGWAVAFDAPFSWTKQVASDFGGTRNGMLENTFINVKNQSKTITAELEIPEGKVSGVILAQGRRFGGWSLYMKDGKPIYTYHFLGLARYTIAAPSALPAGAAMVKLDFIYDGGGLGKGGKAILSSP